MQRGHASLAFGVETGEGLLRGGDGLVGDVFDQPVRGAPGFFGGFADDHMQADAELHRTPMASRSLAHVAIFAATAGNGSPQVR